MIAQQLHPVLRNCVHTTDVGFTMIMHPLVHTFYGEDPLSIELANLCFEQKTKDLDRAIQEHNWNSVVFIHERPYRAEALRRFAAQMPAKTFSELVTQVWSDTESAHQERDVWVEVFKQNHFDCEHAMDELERATFAELSERDQFMVYRGANKLEGLAYKTGLSWTLSKDKAMWFADRWGRSGHVFGRLVTIDDVLFYNNERGEQEIVLNPDYV